MKGLKTLSAVIALATFLVGGVAYACQIDGGNIYYSKNVTTNSAYGDPTSAKPCDVVQYKLRLHNGGPEVIGNVNVKLTIPNTKGTSFSSSATTVSSNGNPSLISDTATVTSTEATTMSYVSGSAKLLDANSGVIKSLSDNVVTSGVDIGSVGVSTQQIRFVTIDAKLACPVPVVSTAECSAINISMVSDSRKVNVTVNTAVNNASIVGYKVDYGDGFVATSKDSNHTYAKDGTYRIVASVQAKYADGTTKWITSDGCAKSVTVTTKVVTPVYSCDLLDITAVNNNRTVTLNKFNYTAKDGASYKNTVINWGDGSANTTVVNVEGQTHSYAKDGTYTVSAVAYFTLSDGSVVSGAGNNCAKTVKFDNAQPPVVTPVTTTPAATPSVLPNTGASKVAAIFGSVTALATLGYGIVSRRLSRQ